MTDNQSNVIVRAPPQTLVPLNRPPERRGVHVIIWQMMTVADVRPQPPPQAPPDLPDLPPLLRLHAAVRLYVLLAEHSLSPGGQLRGFAKLVCRVAITMGIVLLALAGVLALASLVIGIAVAIAAQIVVFLKLLVEAVLLLLALLALAVVLLIAVRMMI